MKTTIIYWDIDGTLLTTGRQGIVAWESAVRTVLGHHLDLTDYNSAGKTDRAIACELMNLAKVAFDPAVEAALIDVYVGCLPGAIKPSIGGALPNVLPTLRHVARLESTISSLITGNMQRAADTKLAVYGLHGYFSRGGFGEDGYDRPSIGRAARARIASLLGPAAIREVLIGDTPHDIACGKALGMATIAVATGAHDAAELHDVSPDHVLGGLPDPEALIVLIDGLLGS